MASIFTNDIKFQYNKIKKIKIREKHYNSKNTIRINNNICGTVFGYIQRNKMQ